MPISSDNIRYIGLALLHMQPQASMHIFKISVTVMVRYALLKQKNHSHSPPHTQKVPLCTVNQMHLGREE